MKQPRRTFIVRLSTTLSFTALASALAEAGDVEHIQLRDGSVKPLTGDTHVPEDKPLRKTPRYTPEGKAAFMKATREYEVRRRSFAVATMSDILRNNAHAPLYKLVDLMNQSPANVSRNSHQRWSEENIKPYIDEALEHVTSPSAPPLKG